MKARITILAKLLISIVSFLIFFSSCKKDQEDQNLIQNDLLFCEQAYPGVQGDTVSTYYRGVLVTCEVINGEYLFQGDIKLVPEQTPSTRAAFINDENLRWPDNTVFYDINDNVPNNKRITDAIGEYKKYTNLDFIQIDKNNPPPNFVEFVYDPEGCASYVGMIGGKQTIEFADWGTVGTAMHEIGHAIGLYHEQSKGGRDAYVSILWENIEEGKEINFKEYPNSINTEGFDFVSIMLYGSKAFSKNGNLTITKKDGRTTFGQRDQLSATDIEMINQMYPHDATSYDAIFNFFGGCTGGCGEIDSYYGLKLKCKLTSNLYGLRSYSIEWVRYEINLSYSFSPNEEELPPISENFKMVFNSEDFNVSDASTVLFVAKGEMVNPINENWYNILIVLKEDKVFITPKGTRIVFGVGSDLQLGTTDASLNFAEVGYFWGKLILPSPYYEYYGGMPKDFGDMLLQDITPIFNK